MRTSPVKRRSFETTGWFVGDAREFHPAGERIATVILIFGTVGMMKRPLCAMSHGNVYSLIARLNYKTERSSFCTSLRMSITARETGNDRHNNRDRGFRPPSAYSFGGRARAAYGDAAAAG